MDATAAAQRDAEYRRGTVLGLTVAEVFILLLFLLLLALLVLVRDWEVERNQLVILQERQDKWQPVFDKFETPEEIERLHQQKDDRLDKWQPIIDEFETPGKIKTLQQQKDEAVRDAKVLRDVLAQSDEATQAAAEQAEARREAEKDLAVAKREIEDTKRELNLLRTKGENPPCWYQTVPDGKRGRREKRLYALNVAVFDDHMILHRTEPPTGGATDDGDSTYAEEAERLPFAAIPYGKPLTDAEIISHLQPIRSAGKEEQVRSYACIFSLRVWDKTSRDAKERWKQAHDGILEGMFGTYTVQEDPWPGIEI